MKYTRFCQLFTIFALVLVLSVGLVGAQEEATGISDAYAGTELRLIMANHPWNNAMQRIFPEFEAASGMILRVESYFEDQLSQRLQIGLTSGMSQADVFMFRPLQEGRLFVQNGWVSDLASYAGGAGDDWNWEDFQPGARGTVSDGEFVFGIPIVTEREIIYYRTDLFEEAGLEAPTTMEELMAAAATFHDPDNNMYGIVMRGQRAGAVTQFSSFLYSFGGDWINEDGTSALDSEEAMMAYDTYGTLLREYGAPGMLNVHWPQAVAIFQQGQAAMYIDADSLYSNFTDPSVSTVADVVGYAQFPAGPAGSRPYNVTSWALGMNAATPNADAAWEFIKWASSPELVLRLQAESGIPGPRTSVWESPEGTAGFPAQYVEVALASSEVGVGYDRPLVIRVGEARDIVGEGIVASIEGRDLSVELPLIHEAFNEFLAAEAAE
jgi:multiple sugar transport system substrate-binding protein